MARAMLSAETVSKEELDLTIQFAASLPEGSAVAVMLQNVVDAMKRGEDVSFLASADELSPNEAAGLLNISRPHLLKVMKRGLITYRMVGTNYRIAVPDLLDYIERNEQGNAYMQELLATRAHSNTRVRDRAAALEEEDLRELDALIG